jgi:hypothetical protein
VLLEEPRLGAFAPRWSGEGGVEISELQSIMLDRESDFALREGATQAEASAPEIAEGDLVSRL